MSEMRSMVASMKGSVSGPSPRKPFDELMEKTPPADDVTCEKGSLGGTPGWRAGQAWQQPVQRCSLNQSLIALCKRGSMKETEAILDEIFRLVSEQAKALEGKLSEEKAVKCRLRAERIKELLERITRDSIRNK
jgi:hypothetical protein